MSAGVRTNKPRHRHIHKDEAGNTALGKGWVKVLLLKSEFVVVVGGG